jgi:hypothetical protein
MIKTLEKEFEGSGDVKCFKYTLFHTYTYAYVYKVEQSDTKYHYEAFERKNTAVCIDFEKRLYSDTEFKEIYPKSNDFGVWAFTFECYCKAIEKAYEINKKRENEKS